MTDGSPWTRGDGRPTPRRAAPTLAAGLALLALAGCHRALFPANAPRTPFDTYDQVRGIYVHLEEPDVFGHPQPALRARLSRWE